MASPRPYPNPRANSNPNPSPNPNPNPNLNQLDAEMPALVLDHFGAGWPLGLRELYEVRGRVRVRVS